MVISIALVIAIAIFIVGIVFAVIRREQSPLFFIVTAGVFLYLFGGVIQ